jgi:transposase
MAKPLLPDDLWDLIRPHLPARPPSPKGGRPRLDDRRALTGILFVLKTGIGWEDLPCEMGCGSGMTCWRRLRDWQQDGTWQKIHGVLLDRLDRAGKIDWSRAAVDSSSVRAAFGGEDTGPNPTDRGKAGSKHHVLVDGDGVPLASKVTAANRHDVTALLALVVGIPLLLAPGRAAERLPARLLGDQAYDCQQRREVIDWLGVKPELARRGRAHGSGLGKERYVAERTLANLHQNRRLRVRYEKRSDIHQAFLTLACIKLCWYRLPPKPRYC